MTATIEPIMKREPETREQLSKRLGVKVNAIRQNAYRKTGKYCNKGEIVPIETIIHFEGKTQKPKIKNTKKTQKKGNEIINSKKKQEARVGAVINKIKEIELFDIPILGLLLFQAYIFARLADIIFLQIEPNHNVPLFILFLLGFFVDSSGFAIALKLDKPKYETDPDPRKGWILLFYVFQIVIDLCYLLFETFPFAYWIGAVLIVTSPALGLFAYSRSKFK